MSNAKRRHRRRRRHRLATEWWHLVIGGRLVLYPPSHRVLQRDPVFLAWAASVAPEPGGGLVGFFPVSRVRE